MQGLVPDGLLVAAAVMPLARHRGRRLAHPLRERARVGDARVD